MAINIFLIHIHEEMAEAIPKHLLEKLSKLYNKTNGNSFTHEEAQEILGITKSYAGRVLPELVKAGWIKSKREKSDGRRKIYYFNDLCEIINEIGKC
ncbi:winged helix-turn-helix domain-containing protein [Methanoplanus limicola]|uniref:HTH marR-type domain-containing protein n=1 Tax=Methanoplanus limicola DSM 2279 TaxID=937775 RepID=H1Z092_9EURY|nr:winged helix-turn-helix domain-containing protein [Methanoplanus limicola]EHQ36184.1 hypothetical protein Metlim_2102 [Methanoplanus limicola DSM 2279]